MGLLGTLVLSTRCQFGGSPHTSTQFSTTPAWCPASGLSPDTAPRDGVRPGKTASVPSDTETKSSAVLVTNQLYVGGPRERLRFSSCAGAVHRIQANTMSAISLKELRKDASGRPQAEMRRVPHAAASTPGDWVHIGVPHLGAPRALYLGMSRRLPHRGLASRQLCLQPFSRLEKGKAARGSRLPFLARPLLFGPLLVFLSLRTLGFGSWCQALGQRSAHVLVRDLPPGRSVSFSLMLHNYHKSG